MSFISTFEELSKLYESVEPETKAAVEEVSTEEVSDELDEGIFDKKNKAELNNMRSDFESEVELIAKKSLHDIAYDLVDLLRSAAGEYKVYAEKKANHQTDNTSMTKIFENKSKQVLQLYVKLIASFKKPNNFYQAASAIDNAAASILEAFAQDSDIPKKIEQYREILLKVNDIKADTKIKQEALKEFFNKLTRYLNDAAQALKKDPESLFEEVSGQAEIGEDDTIDIEIEDDTDTTEVAEDTEEAKQLIIECANCGGLVIKADADVVIDEESDLANVKEACQYCEETAGYKIVGVVAPYDAATEEEELEEPTETEEELTEIFGFGKKKKAASKNSASGKNDNVERRVTFTVYDQNGTTQFDRTFTELPGKMTAEEQFKNAFRDNSRVYAEYCKNKTEWQYERVSEPEDTTWDTKYRDKPARNHFVSRDLHV